MFVHNRRHPSIKHNHPVRFKPFGWARGSGLQPGIFGHGSMGQWEIQELWKAFTNEVKYGSSHRQVQNFLFICNLKVKEMIIFTVTLLLVELAAVPLETLEQKLNDGNQTYLILNDFGQVRPPVLFSWPFQERILSCNSGHKNRLGGFSNWY